MNQKRIFLILALVFALLMGGAAVLYDRLSAEVDSEQLAQQDAPTEENAGESEPVFAPDFTVYDIDGNEVHLSDYFGKPIVLNFWASWCGPCQMEMPHFQEKYEQWGDEVVFLMVNMTDGGRETISTASNFISRGGYTFPVFFDLHYDAATAYSVYYLPTTYFLDAQGNVVTYYSGALSAETLQQGIDMIL